MILGNVDFSIDIQFAKSIHHSLKGFGDDDCTTQTTPSGSGPWYQ